MATRRFARLGALLAVAALVVLVPSSANALDCTGDPPPMQTPTSAPGAGVDRGPDDPNVGEPFADPPTSSIYETYGYAGLLWTTYDLGCGPDIARSPEAVTFTSLANSVASLSQAVVGISASLTRWGLNPSEWLTPFDVMLESIADVMSQPFAQALVIAGLIIGAWMIARARSVTNDYAATASTAGRVVALAAIGVFLLGYPATAAQTFDEWTAGIVDGVQSDLAGGPGESSELGVGLTANIHRNVLYTTWQQGQFGNAASPIAEEYSGPLFDSLTRTIEEDELAQDDPAYAAELAAEKGGEYERIVAEIKEKDPEAYAHVIGQRSYHRVYSALIGGFSATVATLFNSLAALFIMAGYAAVRLLVMFGPILVILGVINLNWIIGPAMTVGALVATGMWFGIASGFFAVVQQALLSSTLPAWGVALFILAMAGAFWRMTKAIRRDKYGRSRVDPYDFGGPARRGFRTAKRLGLQYITTRAAVDHGVTDAEEFEEKREKEEASQGAGEVYGVSGAEHPASSPATQSESPAPSPYPGDSPAAYPAGQSEPAGSLPPGSSDRVPSAPSVIVMERSMDTSDDEEVWRPSDAT